MKLKDITVGGRYVAKVSGVLTTVRVLAIREVPPAWHLPESTWRTRIDVVNERTGRKTTFASAAKLRRVAVEPKTDPATSRPTLGHVVAGPATPPRDPSPAPAA